MDKKEIKFLLMHSSIYGLGTIVSQAVAFIMLPIYTRHLTPADYGVLELLDTTIMLISLVVTIGIGRGMSRFYYEEDNSNYRCTVISSTYIMFFGLSLVFLPVLIYLSPTFSEIIFSTSDYGKYFTISFVNLVMGGLIDIGLVYLRLEKKPVFFISITISRLIVVISLNIVFVVFLKMGVWGILLSTFITRIIYAIVITVPLLWKTGLEFSFQLSSNIIKFCLPMIPANLFSALIRQSDKYFVLFYLSIAEAGIYSLALKLGNVIHVLITMPFIMTYVPRRFEIMKSKEASETLKQVYTYYSFLFIFLGLALSVLIPEILMIMATPKFYAAGPYIPLIVLSMFLFGCQYHFDFGILYSKKTKYFAYINFIIAGIHIGLNFILISRYGIWGAIWASVVVLGTQALLYLYVSNRYYKIDYELLRVIKYLLLSIVFFFLSRSIHFDNTLYDILLKLMLLLVFILTSILCRIIRSNEVEAVKKIFAGRFSVFPKKQLLK